jgi:hypothetical protein
VAIKLKNGKGFKCMFCSFQAVDVMDVEVHQRTHNFVLLPILESELSQILQYFFTKDDKLIPQGLYERIKLYNNNMHKRVAKSKQEDLD